MWRCFNSLFLVFAAFAFFPGQAYAYIDMGTGSMVFQMLAAGLIGLMFTIKMYWLSLKQKVHTLFLKMAGRSEASHSESNRGTDK